MRVDGQAVMHMTSPSNGVQWDARIVGRQAIPIRRAWMMGRAYQAPRPTPIARNVAAATHTRGRMIQKCVVEGVRPLAPKLSCERMENDRKEFVRVWNVTSSVSRSRVTYATRVDALG
jgi:hypothetical protein